MFIQLDLKTLNDLDDGRVAAAFMHELKRGVLDCMDRPGDTKSRAVALVFELTPVIEPDGTCETARGTFKIKSKVPDRQSKTYEFNLRKNGVLAFSENSPDGVDQTTFEDIDPSTGKVRR